MVGRGLTYIHETQNIEASCGYRQQQSTAQQLRQYEKLNQQI